MPSKTAKELFIENNKEIADCKIKDFSLVVFPLSLSTMKVLEHIREDYSALELIILRLIDSGVSNKELLCKATGLTMRMINNIIQNELDYNHIKVNDDNSITVLEGGTRTLNDQSNSSDSQEHINHKYYENPRTLQFDIMTGTVLAGARKYDPRFNNYAFAMNESIFKDYDEVTILKDGYDVLKISDEVKKDIVSGLYSNYPASEDVTVERITDIIIDEVKYGFAYYVVTEKPKMNLLVIRTQKLGVDGNPIISYEPIAIPKGLIDNQTYKYTEKDLEDFNMLISYEDKVNSNNYDLEEIIAKNDSLINESLAYSREKSKEDRKNNEK